MKRFALAVLAHMLFHVTVISAKNDTYNHSGCIEIPVLKKATDTTRYISLNHWMAKKFMEANTWGRFDQLCLEDCISFTFNLTANGEINITGVSKFTPSEVTPFLKKAVSDLNLLPITQKPFVQVWLNDKHAGKSILQPVYLLFEKPGCRPVNLSTRGILSMLTKETDSMDDLNKLANGRSRIGGAYNVKPFEGIILTPIMIQSPYR